MKRPAATFAPAAALVALACACSTTATRDGGALTQQQQQGLAPQRQLTAQQQPSPQSARPNLCRGQRSPLPAPAGRVSDFAKVIDAGVRQRLEAQLAELNKATGVEFAVVTVETTGGRDIFDYSIDVACGWGVGPNENGPGGGVLLLVATRDRRWRTQISRNLESALPDAAVKEIGDRMVEHFKRGDFGAGVSAAVEEHAALLAPNAAAPRPTP